MKNEILRQMKRKVVGLVFMILLFAVIRFSQQRGFVVGDVCFFLVIIFLYTTSAIFKARVELLRKEDEQVKKAE